MSHLFSSHHGSGKQSTRAHRWGPWNIFFCGKVAPFGSRNPAPLKTNLKTIKQALGTQNHPVAADDAIPKFHWVVSWWNKAVIGSPGLKTTAPQNETCASHLLSIPIDIVKTRPEKNRKNKWWEQWDASSTNKGEAPVSCLRFFAFWMLFRNIFLK